MYGEQVSSHISVTVSQQWKHLTKFISLKITLKQHQRHAGSLVDSVTWWIHRSVLTTSLWPDPIKYNTELKLNTEAFNLQP